ncbi:MAG: DUF433 domain-containing protein [Planctomycetes bacterium]|nr:DUF433 domain-containing protein [Planctomycetota bacterium]
MPTPKRRTGKSRGRRIVCHPRVLGGKPVIEGTRMSVEQILGLIAGGMTVEKIVRSYPLLTAADVRSAVAYAQRALRDDIVVDVSR